MLLPVAVGGNGGNAAADAIQQECEKQGVHTLVAACPKSFVSDFLVVCAGPVTINDVAELSGLMRMLKAQAAVFWKVLQGGIVIPFRVLLFGSSSVCTGMPMVRLHYT